MWQFLKLQVASCIFYLFTFIVVRTNQPTKKSFETLWLYVHGYMVDYIVCCLRPCFKYVPTLIEHFNHKKIDHLTSEIGCA